MRHLSIDHATGSFTEDQQIIITSSVCIWLIIPFRVVSSELPVIIVPTPSPCIPLPLDYIGGRGSVNKRGGFAPSLQFFPPLLLKERGIKGVKLISNKSTKTE